MQLRTKISILFTVLSSLVLLFSFSLVYYLSFIQSRDDFFGRLKEKADFISQKNYEEDELSKQVYQQIIEKNIKTMPDASVITLNVNNPQAIKDSLKAILSNNLINQLLSGKNIQFSEGENQGIGLYYPDNQGTFIIIVSAYDKNGIKKLNNLFYVLVNIFWISLIIIYLIGILYSRKVLAPIYHILTNVKRISATNLKLRLKENNGKSSV